MNDVQGVPLHAQNYTEIEGSPYLVDYWSKGYVKFSDGETYKQLDLKYDILNDIVFFKNRDGETLNFIKKVQEFTLELNQLDKSIIKHYKSGFNSIDHSTNNSYFEILCDGTVQLVKRQVKNILETKEFNSATTKKTFVESDKYYLYASDKLIPLKRNKKFFLTVLNNKQDKIDSYIKTNNPNFDNDDDLAKLINYYNSI